MAAAPSTVVSHDALLFRPPRESSVNDFFIRAGLTPQDQLDCYNFIEHRYPGTYWKQAPCQGYCSLTIFVNDDVVIQFRPDNYRLDVQMVQAAREVYGSFVPDTKYLATLPGSGLLVYAMNRITGASLKSLREIPAESYTLEHRARLCVDFAVFMSRAWHYGSMERIPLGVVGRSIVSRLRCLSTELPVRFRPVAEQLLEQIPLIEALPWVLTHGDIVPGNIVVNPSSGELLGIVDWAEAERLPFGICLYGLEEILGEMTASGFRYDIQANELRCIFWDKLKNCIPELLQPASLKAVKLARDLGVLLWHGIAFDNGAIDRVVQEGRDADEIRRLDAFLELPDDGRHKESKAHLTYHSILCKAL
jgi:hypothetical protein